MNPSGQLHVGVWLITEHTAPEPQAPTQGSLHFSRMHAKLLGHSELIVHSGRQVGGLPKKLGKQEQDGTPPTSLHSLLGPHGDGIHGFIISCLMGSCKGAKIGSFIYAQQQYNINTGCPRIKSQTAI